MTFIDTHLHLWEFSGLGSENYAWLVNAPERLHRSYTAEQAQEAFSAQGVSSVILVQADDSVADTEFMMQVAAENPWVLGVIGWVPLEEPTMAQARLDELCTASVFKGVRQLIHDDPRNQVLELPTFQRTAQQLAARALVLEVPDAFPRQLLGATQLVRAIPELVVVLDHLAKPPFGSAEAWPVWRQELQDFAQGENSYAKLSGLYSPATPYTVDTLRPAWEEALAAFGPQRLMLGSDWPVSLGGASYAETMHPLLELLEELSPSEQEAIRYGTAEQVYRLPESGPPHAGRADSPEAVLTELADARRNNER